MTAPLLSLRHISKRFGSVEANRDVDLDVQPGEILALLGENGAGKTTLCNIASGMVQADRGTISVDGARVDIRSPRDARRHGIGMVHQHFVLVPDMTVAENVALGLPARRPPLSDVDAIASELEELSERYALKVRPRARVEDLSVGEQQRVEIIKVLYRRADVLVLDEPTSVLTPGEWEHLARVLRDLAAGGKAIILVTHKLEEALSVADRCTVLRDGAVVATVEVAHTSKAELARLMVGRDVVIRVDWSRLVPGTPVLEVQDLCLVGEDGRLILDHITLEVREREVVGIAGVDGNGQTELLETLIGVRQPSSGTIRIKGLELGSFTPADFVAHGGAFIPDDRHGKAIALPLTLRDNLIMKVFLRKEFSRHGLLRDGKIDEYCRELAELYDIRTPGIQVRMGQLSGGNQQKAIVARELHRTPRLLIAAQPTRGLDVGAVEFVYEQMQKHRQRGGATLLISTELDEILSLSDRVAVVTEGRMSEPVTIEHADPQRIGLLMAGEIEGVP